MLSTLEKVDGGLRLCCNLQVYVSDVHDTEFFCVLQWTRWFLLYLLFILYYIYQYLVGNLHAHQKMKSIFVSELFQGQSLQNFVFVWRTIASSSSSFSTINQNLKINKLIFIVIDFLVLCLPQMHPRIFIHQFFLEFPNSVWSLI